jgi:potassium-dependent mechanosensitive channel
MITAAIIAAIPTASMLDRLRSRIPDSVNIAELSSAVAIVILAFIAGHFAGLAIGKRIAGMMDAADEDDGSRTQNLMRSSARFWRYAIAAGIMAVARFSWDWQLYSELLFGGAIAIAVGMAVYGLLRAIQLGFWTSAAAASSLFAFLLSSLVGGLTPLTDVLDQASFVLGSHRISLLTITSAILIGIFLIAAVRIGIRAIRLFLGQNKGLDGGQKLLIEKLAMVAFVIAAFFIGVDMLGIDLTAFAVFSGAFGLAIGFGLQKTFGNLIAGIILLMDRSTKPGDVIVVGDSFGSVNKIGIRAVSVLTRDGKEHLIPNENLMTNEVENWSYSSRNVRVKIPVGVSYASDMELVEQLILQAVNDSPRVLKRPAPAVWMQDYAESSVNFEIQAWIRDPEEGVGNVRSDILKRLWWLFKEHNVEIPFPQRDVHIRQVADAKAAIKPAKKKPAPKP